jgi:hypothetical protein
MRSRLDPHDIHGREWEVFEVTPEYRRSRLWIDEMSYVQRTEYLAEDRLVESNRQAFDDSLGKRFGDGRIVARIPLNVLYGSKSEIAAKLRQGDRDHLKWFLNRGEARPWRRFRGKL